MWSQHQFLLHIRYSGSSHVDVSSVNRLCCLLCFSGNAFLNPRLQLQEQSPLLLLLIFSPLSACWRWADEALTRLIQTFLFLVTSPPILVRSIFFPSGLPWHCPYRSSFASPCFSFHPRVHIKPPTVCVTASAPLSSPVLLLTCMFTLHSTVTCLNNSVSFIYCR